MTIQEKRFKSIRSLLNFLQGLASDRKTLWVFRGHSSKKNRLKTSMERYTSIPHEERMQKMESMLNVFRDGLIRTGISHPATDDRLTWMELARHHGVPAPILDFSWSPYVGLFFAFNRVRERPKGGGESVIYALNINQLGRHWARENAEDPHGPSFSEKCNEFVYPGQELFREGLPENTFRFLPWPGEHSPRMQRQMGAFLFSTLNYGHRKVEDLEGFISQLEDGFDSPCLPNLDDPTIIKMHVPHRLAGEVFAHLELMNITGASLMGSADGAADDIWNAFNYNPKIFLRNRSRIGS